LLYNTWNRFDLETDLNAAQISNVQEQVLFRRHFWKKNEKRVCGHGKGGSEVKEDGDRRLAGSCSRTRGKERVA
jgi:hypothetical protein